MQNNEKKNIYFYHFSQLSFKKDSNNKKNLNINKALKTYKVASQGYEMQNYNFFSTFIVPILWNDHFRMSVHETKPT